MILTGISAAKFLEKTFLFATIVHFLLLPATIVQILLVQKRISSSWDWIVRELIGKNALYLSGISRNDAWSSSAHVVYTDELLLTCLVC